MAEKWTPGKWTTGISITGVIWIIDRPWDERGRKCLALVRNVGESTIHNAALIAAAPQLYEACDEALNALIACAVPAGGCDDRKHLLDAQARLRAALAAARGEE